MPTKDYQVVSYIGPELKAMADKKVKDRDITMSNYIKGLIRKDLTKKVR